MLTKLILLIISFSITICPLGCKKQSSEDQLKKTILKIEYLLEKGNIEELVDTYSYVEVPEDVLEEVKSEFSEDELNELKLDDNFKEIYEIQMKKAAKSMLAVCKEEIIKKLEEAKGMTPKINTKKTSAVFSTGLEFTKIDGNWRWNIDSYMMGSPSSAAFLYTLY